jgi:predicted dehydrogenase
MHRSGGLGRHHFLQNGEPIDVTSTPVRVVLVGLGTRGAHWADVLARSGDCETVAFVDPSAAALEAAQVRFGPHPAFLTLDEALNAVSDVHALVLATPPTGREPQIRAACERGLALLVEKPLALDLNEAASHVRMAESAAVPLMVGLNFRYLAVTRALVKLLAEGDIGTPEFAHFTYERWRDGQRPGLNKYPLTMAQPMLWEQSIHHFDLLRYVYSQEPTEVYCRAFNPSWSMYRESANVSAIFTFDQGVIATYQGTWQSAWQEPSFSWRTDASEGVAIQGDQFGDLGYARRHDDALTPITLPVHEMWITETSGLLASFVAAIAHGEPLECSGRDHLRSLAMVEACIVSSQESRAVDVRSLLDSLPT